MLLLRDWIVDMEENYFQDDISEWANRQRTKCEWALEEEMRMNN